MTDAAGVELLPFFLPYDGSYVRESVDQIPSAFVDRGMLDLFGVASDGRDNRTSLQALRFTELVIDRDRSLDAMESPVAVTLFCLATIVAVPHVFQAMQIVRTRQLERRKVAKVKGPLKFGVRDLLYAGQVFQFVLTLTFTTMTIWVSQLQEYPHGMAGAGGCKCFCTTRTMARWMRLAGERPAS